MRDIEVTYSLLEAVRGAGMSQRTRRPYLCVANVSNKSNQEHLVRRHRRVADLAVGIGENIPLELISKIASSCAMAEASHIQSGARARHPSMVGNY